MLTQLFEWTKDFDSADTFLKERKILAEKMVCSVCQQQMSLIKNRDTKVFRCKAHKNQKASIKKGSFLQDSKITLQEFIRIAYVWSRQITGVVASDMCEVSGKTICSWYQYLRDATSHHMVMNPYQIGGPGHVVQIDESLICKRKYNRGRVPEQRWVFGGWDTEDKIGFLVFVSDRSSDTLIPLIKKYIKPGTTIHSDSWRAYTPIDQINLHPRYIHKQVNHSQHFVDPVSGVHTNKVECFWKNAKTKFKTMMGVHSSTVESHLDEFLWREV